MKVLRSFSGSLDDFLERAGGAVAPAKGLFGGGKASPMRSEWVGGKLGILFLARLLVGHRHPQIKGGVLADLFDQLAIEVLAIGHHQRMLTDGIEDGLGHWQQLRSGLRAGAGGTGAGETNRRVGVRVQAEEGLGDLDGLEPGIVAEADHLALAGTVGPQLELSFNT